MVITSETHIMVTTRRLGKETVERGASHGPSKMSKRGRNEHAPLQASSSATLAVSEATSSPASPKTGDMARPDRPVSGITSVGMARPDRPVSSNTLVGGVAVSSNRVRNSGSLDSKSFLQAIISLDEAAETSGLSAVQAFHDNLENIWKQATSVFRAIPPECRKEYPAQQFFAGVAALVTWQFMKGPQPNNKWGHVPGYSKKKQITLLNEYGTNEENFRMMESFFKQVIRSRDLSRDKVYTIDLGVWCKNCRARYKKPTFQSWDPEKRTDGFFAPFRKVYALLDVRHSILSDKPTTSAPMVASVANLREGGGRRILSGGPPGGAIATEVELKDGDTGGGAGAFATVVERKDDDATFFYEKDRWASPNERYFL